MRELHIYVLIHLALIEKKVKYSGIYVTCITSFMKVTRWEQSNVVTQDLENVSRDLETSLETIGPGGGGGGGGGSEQFKSYETGKDRKMTSSQS